MPHSVRAWQLICAGVITTPNDAPKWCNPVGRISAPSLHQPQLPLLDTFRTAKRLGTCIVTLPLLLNTNMYKTGIPIEPSQP
jgi:hypothetical protein